MKILVTGAGGFVGSHLLRLLAKSPHQLIGTWYDRLPHPEIRFLNRKLRWVYCDLTKPASIQRLLSREKPDTVYHLAAQASVAKSWKSPQETFAVNVLGTLHLLEALVASGHRSTVVLIESGEVYGRGIDRRGQITESTPLAPENPYASSKACQDLLLLSYLNHRFLKIIRLRPFNHIGPGQGTDYVAGSFAAQVAAIEAGKQAPVVRVGNLKAKRDFTDVRDMVRAYLLAAKKGKSGEVYNVASGKAVPIETLLKKLLSLSRVPIEVRRDPSRMRPNDIPVLYAVPKKLRAATGWKPRTSLTQSLKDTLNFWRKQYA